VSAAIRVPTDPGSIRQPGVLTTAHEECDDEAVVAAPHEREAIDREASYDLVDLRPLKRVARGLPENDPARRLIEGEPDLLPPSVLAAKADSWVLLLFRPEG